MTIASEITDLQTNLANAKSAVTAKGGTVADTGLAGLASEIATIPSGGGNADKCVKFFDYNGDLVASYTVAEANALAELPSAPTHADLEFVEWTETLAHVNGATGPMYIGATFQDALSHGNDTVITYHPIANSPSVRLRFKQDVANGVTIDWGDGTPLETFSDVGDVTVSHSYAYSISTGDQYAPYVVRISPSQGTTLTLGQGGNYTAFYDAALGSRSRLVIGKCVFSNYAFYNAISISEMVLSNKILSVTGNTFSADTIDTASNISTLIFPSNYPFVNGEHIRSQCIKTVIVSSSLTGYYLNLMGYIGEHMPLLEGAKGLYLGQSRVLEDVVVPDIYTNVYSFSGSRNLKKVVIPASVTSISGSSFSECVNLKEIVFKDRDDLTFIPNNLFNSSTRNMSLEILDFTDFTQVPSINSYLFSGLPFYTKILVPASLESAWKTANIWSTRASQIIGV